MVNEPSVFESLKFYCISLDTKGKELISPVDYKIFGLSLVYMFNNNIHTIMVMALTLCDNTLITYGWKKRQQALNIEFYQIYALCPLW